MKKRVAALALLTLLLTACRSAVLEITAAPLPTLAAEPVPTSGPVMVTVAGAVEKPGRYMLPPGALADDAVRAAGGALPDADLTQVNLARELHDGDRIRVPRVGEVLPTPTPYGLRADGRLDINLADAALLETLPKIGPTTAQNIVAYREVNGPFETVEQIQEVKGIGPTTFDAIRDLITVGDAP